MGQNLYVPKRLRQQLIAGITGFNLALQGKNFNEGNGLLKDCVENTIRNVGYVAKEGMKQTDITVLKSMIQK